MVAVDLAKYPTNYLVQRQLLLVFHCGLYLPVWLISIGRCLERWLVGDKCDDGVEFLGRRLSLELQSIGL